MKRGDIALCDVFISWTGTDQAIKEAIAVALRSSGILPLLSDERCQGDFEEWSREAATSAHVFMPVITNASLSSVGMGWEIEAYDKKLSSDEGEYFREAFLPIAESLELYQSYLSRLSESSRAILEKHSAILLTFTENRTVSEKSLDEIVTKTAERLSSSFFRLYLQKSSVKHIKLFSLYTENAKDENYSFDDLYVPRTVTRTDTEDAVCLTSPQPLFVPNTVSMIVGAASSGKTQYVNEIKQAHTDDTLIISLTCTDAAESPLSLFDLLYEEFHRICSQRIFYTKDNFRRLLDIKNLTIVFDGMDEITTKREKRYLVEKIETYYLANTNTALIFTSRDENDADFLALSSTPTAKYRLDSLNPDNITTLSYNLFSLLGVPEQTDAFREKLQELSEGIRTNPLFISQLALVYYETGTLPATEIGILDAVSKIILKSDSQRHKLTVPDRYLDMIEHDITDILKQFSRESYIKNTEGKHLDYSKILHHVVKKKYAEDKDALRSRCQYLSDYLENRAIMESGKFYHKSFLEYFTALSYADKAFDEDYGEIDDDTVIRELFSYYQNPYWEKVIAMFLIKADLTLEDTAMASLYEEILSPDIDEYSLLLHAGQDFVNHRDLTERLIAQKLLTESINGSVAPYGELFWYVPTYHLYHALLCALETLPPDAKALALVRDVAFITGGYATARAIDPSCDSDKLFRRAKASLTGVRRQLCEIFYLSEPTLVESAGIYPRCFDPREALSVKENGHGTFARMQIPFDDELGLFSHEQFPEANGQYLGFVSTMYRKDALEEKLSKKKHDRITVLALTPKQGNHMEYIHFVRSNVRAFYVPETITSFADDATLYMNLIWQIKILDDLPVYLPKHIRTIHIPDTFTVISAGAFQNLTSLETVILPESLTEIGEKAFENCLSLTDIHLPDSLRRIGNSAFAECQSLKQITLPEGLTDLDAFVFLGCSSLVSAHLSPSLKELPWSTFAFCEALTDVHLPEGLTSIGDMAFAGCSSLTAIDFPKSLEKIGWCAFSACLSLLTAELPEGLREIGIRAFADCTALQSIHLPSTLTMLRENAFENCSSLSEIHLPDSLREVGDYAFRNCVALTTVTLSAKLSFVNSTVFENCPSIERVYMTEKQSRLANAFSESAEFFDKFTHRELLIYRESDSVIAGGLQGIILPHTYQSRPMRSVLISERVRIIGVSAFEGCTRLCEVILPKTLKEIGSAAFKNCKSLRTISLPPALTTLDTGAFYGCSSLTEMDIPDTVTTLSGEVFYGCTSLKRVRLPHNAVRLPNSLFEGCRSLEAISLNPSTESIGASTFRGCSSLREIELPNTVTHIDYAAFQGCTALESIDLPDSVSFFSNAVFADCHSLSYVRLPETLSYVPMNLFENCSSLANIALPDSVSTIGLSAFFGCCALTAITLPEGLMTIEAHAFKNCTALRELVIPKAVRYIENSAFLGCTALTAITISANFKNDIKRIFGEIDPSIITFI